ncbi:MAG: DUF4386 family protein [Anaerolineae bacterium]|nr:DUF4386 family protein [Anaerolineae bacterium]
MLTLAFYLIEMLVIVAGESYPATVGDWYALFQHDTILGLLYINALDIFSIALLAPMFLALYLILRKTHASYAALGGLFAAIGIPVFVTPRAMMLAVLPLSERYAAASTAAEQTQLLAAGETLSALGAPTPQTIGFLFIATAVLILSLVMLRSSGFSKATAYVGLLASIFTIADHISLIIAPSLTGPLLGLVLLSWMIWWIMISRKLLQLGRHPVEVSGGAS